MNKAFSIYLDLVRFAAACLVYLYHSNQRLLSTDILPASNFGHSAVIVFFVLSGFVIAFITSTKENQWAQYAASRISRVYSVAFPTVFITIALDAVGRYFYPALYDYPFDQFIVRSASSLMLLNEVWFISITSFSNVPYWSICYEFWYYAAFAAITFLPQRLAAIAIAVLALVLGPKVILLAPIWIAGVVLYRWRLLSRISPPTAWLMLLSSIAGIWAYHYWQISELASGWLKSLIGDEWHKQLTFSKFFVADYLLGALVFINFAAMRALGNVLEPVLLFVERPVRTLAAYTLTLYLLHQPLFLFWAAVIRGNPDTPLYWWMTTIMVALSVFAIGYITENRRHLLKRAVEKLLRRSEQIIADKWHAFSR